MAPSNFCQSGPCLRTPLSLGSLLGDAADSCLSLNREAGGTRKEGVMNVEGEDTFSFCRRSTGLCAGKLLKGVCKIQTNVLS